MTEVIATTMYLHGVEYFISVRATAQSKDNNANDEESALDILIENTDTTERWASQVGSSYIEELSLKMGNYKRFHIFLQMLISAIRQQSSSVVIDFLTFKDLQKYRNNSNNADSSHHPSVSKDQHQHLNSTRRYLVLTYTVEFDRIHYPIGLTFVDRPSNQMLQQTIQRLKKELKQGQQQIVTNDENNPKTNTSNHGLMNDSSTEIEKLKKENRNLSQSYQRLRTESAKDLRELKQQLLAKQQRPQHMSSTTLNSAKPRTDAKEITMMKKKFEHEKQVLNEAHVLELEQLHKNQKDLELKNSELMRQLAIARMTINKSTFSGYTNPSPECSNELLGPLSPSSSFLDIDSKSFQRTDAKVDRSPPDHYPQSRSMKMMTSSDTEVVLSKEKRSQHRQHRVKNHRNKKTFRRFDPTAYQREREQKQALQNRMNRNRRNLRQAYGESRRSTNPNGYASDGSSNMNGYLSSDSNASSTMSSSSRRRQTRLNQRSSVSTTAKKMKKKVLATPKQHVAKKNKPQLDMMMLYSSDEEAREERRHYRNTSRNNMNQNTTHRRSSRSRSRQREIDNRLASPKFQRPPVSRRSFGSPSPSPRASSSRLRLNHLRSPSTSPVRRSSRGNINEQPMEVSPDIHDCFSEMLVSSSGKDAVSKQQQQQPPSPRVSSGSSPTDEYSSDVESRLKALTNILQHAKAQMY